MRSACLAFLLAFFAPLATGANGQTPIDASLRPAIAAALVRPEGAGFMRYRWDREPAIVALYFGADWCGPCHAFVPKLRNVRDALHKAGADTEVVYVSLDATAGDMRRYMRLQDMPWPAIDHRRLRMLPAIRALGGIAPPSLVLVDRDGKVLASAWDGHRYRGLQPVLETWRQALVPPAHERRCLGLPVTRCCRSSCVASSRSSLARVEPCPAARHGRAAGPARLRSAASIRWPLAAIERLRLRVNALALPMNADLGGVA